MGVLLNKLRRTLWNTRGQVLAVAAVVVVGITVYIAMTTTYNNLTRSRDDFYRENNFADYYFYVVRAPEQVVRQVEALSGVAEANGRIQKDVPIFKEGNQKATARVTSYPVPVAGINRLQLQSGRIFENHPPGGGTEVLVDQAYLKANRLSFNDTVSIINNGKKVDLTVVGTAISPEFTYIMKDAASFMPDPETFGLIMMPLSQAQQVLDLPGQINQVVIKLTPGADGEKVAEEVEAILAPYGNLASYPLKDQLSNAVLQGELDSLKAVARFMPALFLGIAAAIQMVMLGRMIRAQRLQIGIMKALGYNNKQIMTHYTAYSLATSLLGALLGTLLGVGLASAMSGLYADYFNLPRAIGGVNTFAALSGLGLSLLVGAASGLFVSRGVLAINPAEAMRPEPPKIAGSVFLERLTWFWRVLDSTWRMSLRTALRNRGRFATVLAGVTVSVGMLVISLFTNDIVDYMIDKQYYVNQRHDYLVRFESPVKESDLLEISRIDGVIKVEPIFEIPVKISFKGRSEDDLLQGMPPDATLKLLEDREERPLRLPGEGLLINERTAAKLGVREGDRVEVETRFSTGPSRQSSLTVVGINRQLVGSGSFVSLEQANLVIQERHLVSGVMLKVDPGLAGALEEKLSDMNRVASVLSRQKELDNFNEYIGVMIYSITIMVAFAMIMGFAIVYNASVISFIERKRELAALRVLGFTNREISALLLKENLLQSVLGVAAGLPFGRLLGQAYINAASTDLFTMPVVIYPLTYVWSALGGVCFIAVAHLLAVRGVQKLDLVNVLKNGD
ncbi:MAG: outer membrane-specific lipoprotein transporter subunit LolE [Pelotomaculum sp. PtaB.Bin104]|nr:MAG: outer membrane-specific lipoprotein transporter subunit LolE [Pelotomaculum sp. PtaB.Bin104]